MSTEEVDTLESQQREYANNWRNMIASNMWTDAVGNGSQRWWWGFFIGICSLCSGMMCSFIWDFYQFVYGDTTDSRTYLVCSHKTTMMVCSSVLFSSSLLFVIIIMGWSVHVIVWKQHSSFWVCICLFLWHRFKESDRSWILPTFNNGL